MTRHFRLFSVLLAGFFLFTLPLAAQWVDANPVKNVTAQPDGVQLELRSGFLRFRVCTDSIVQIVYSMEATPPEHQDFIIVKKDWPKAEFEVKQSDPKLVTLTTAKLKFEIERENSSFKVFDTAGNLLALETTRTLTPVEVNGEKTYRSERFATLWGSDEAFYGLGQHQAGVWNYRGEEVELSQDNTNITVPLLISSNGYGILWNNGSKSIFNNRFASAFYLGSEVADSIDYYFLYGPKIDRVIGAYRELTGQAPLFGKWAYGFWQCKNRYASQDEIVGVVKKYREMKIPLDNVVQDWFWWNTMGEHVFNKNYPDAKGMIEQIHQENAHLMISVWPFFRPGTAVYDDMTKRGFFVDKTKTDGFHPAGMGLYDAFNPEARKYYWNLMDKALFKIGADAWWLDTTEPETEGRQANILAVNKVKIGSGARYSNEFPLMTTTAVYEGQRSESDQKRVFILSRSGFAGVQRNSASVWSGDVHSTWEVFKRQIPAGLNLSISGVPYWTTDIGGFTEADPDDPAYRELYVRWFEFGTFSPVFRAHGTRKTNQNEIWSYGADAQKILTKYDALRYRLMPYIYSLGWNVTHDGATILRPLVMDFPTDVRAQNIGDEYEFGPALLVSPVTEPGATTKHLYLPAAKWYDFWTGASLTGPRTLDTGAGIETIPLFVRAGSIVPMGPDVQYAMQKTEEPFEVRVYQGANGQFTLYEDEGDTYDYEKGIFATIPFSWDEGTQTLSIGERAGKFPGMAEARSFKIVFVKEGHGVGGQLTADANQTVQYSGKTVTVRP
jgi:alpha-D-xyloside xylohydrolase